MFSCSVLDPLDLNQLFSKMLYGFYMLFSFGRRLQNGFAHGSFEILSVVRYDRFRTKLVSDFSGEENNWENWGDPPEGT